MISFVWSTQTIVKQGSVEEEFHHKIQLQYGDLLLQRYVDYLKKDLGQVEPGQTPFCFVFLGVDSVDSVDLLTLECSGVIVTN